MTAGDALETGIAGRNSLCSDVVRVMPNYDYLCQECGPFTQMRPMRDCDLPSACPDCGGMAPRAMLTAPFCSTVSPETRLAHATNERSANAPKTLSSLKASHGSGCGCCTPTKPSRAAHTKTGDKSFPNSRPWMISH